MNYEKKYKEEIIRATQLWECGDITRENLEYIFPELAESEDERIRKELIDYINRLTVTPNNIDRYNSWIAWLEKQGEQKWSEEDEKNRCNLMSTLSNLRHRAIKEETFQRYYTWLKTLKNGRKIIKQQEPSWAKTSEECKHDALEKGEDLRKWLNFEKTHEGTVIIIPKDLKGTDTDGGVVGEKGEQGEQFTEEEMVGMGGLGKVWKEQAIINKLDKIIELLQSAILHISRRPYVPPIIYKNPLDPDPNTLGGWETTASTEGGGE